jgi:Major membrane immunogen, membrane-anchored lipoprotein
MKLSRLVLALLLFSLAFAACKRETDGMRDGYYTAEASGYDADGWKDFLTIYVSGGSIITVEYNARNKSGFVRSWDVDYQRAVKARTGEASGSYARAFAMDLRNRMDPSRVDSLPGGEKYHTAFTRLAEAVMARSRNGDKMVAIVDLPGHGTESTPSSP